MNPRSGASEPLQIIFLLVSLSFGRAVQNPSQAIDTRGRDTVSPPHSAGGDSYTQSGELAYRGGASRATTTGERLVACCYGSAS
ncbi:hypothetical protein PG994_000631 [Apiospora phragmitis]|uniref:Secreted protein n=1 Tax=Apiospora phragmitis TaxID=2905665 RepID=A0ABR1X6X0_9PEZI